jgi:hypothetical protein
VVVLPSSSRSLNARAQRRREASALTFKSRASRCIETRVDRVIRAALEASGSLNSECEGKNGMDYWRSLTKRHLPKHQTEIR